MQGHFFCGILHKTTIITAYTFQRHEKLKSRKLTDQLFKEGKGFNVFPFRVQYLISENGFKIPEGKAFQPDYPIQFGVGVGTRYFKKAVHRNRIKRLMREVWRLQKHVLYETATAQNIQCAVFFMFIDKTLPEYKLVSEKMNVAISKLQQLLTKQ